jgi:DNA-binding SARP family transcriptional activator
VDRIVDVLWAGKPPAAAEHNVATLVSRLRGVLGSGIIVGGRHGYRLAGEPDVGVDLDAAARFCEQATRKLPAAPAIALAAAEQAVGLLSADVGRGALRDLGRPGPRTAAPAAPPGPPDRRRGGAGDRGGELGGTLRRGGTGR